jgi:hypothetical protein
MADASATSPANRDFRQDAVESLTCRMADIESYLSGQDSDDGMLDPLEISERVEKHVLLSWGGPSDGFRIFFKDGEAVEGHYYKANWGEYQQIDLSDSEVQQVVEAFGLDAC